MDNWRYTLTPKRRGGQLETWQVRVFTPDNRRLHVSLGTTDRDEAEARMEAWAQDVLPSLKRDYQILETAEREDQDDPRLSTLFDYFLDTYCRAKGLSESSLKRYREALRDFELFARKRHVGRASQLSRRIVDEWSVDMADRNWQPKTRHTNITTLRACLNALTETGVLTYAPIQKWLTPKAQDPEVYPLELEQVRRVLAIVAEHQPNIANVVQWIAHTGNRPSDAQTLLWRQIDMQTATVDRTQIKTGRLAQYQLSAKAMAVLKAELKRNRPGPQGEVFTNTDGEPFNPNYILRLMKRALDAGGFKERPVTLKDLRHTFAYHLVNTVNTPLPIVQVLLGHRDIKMTMRYVRPGDARDYLNDYANRLDY